MTLRSEYQRMSGKTLPFYGPGLEAVFGVGQSLEVGYNGTLEERIAVGFVNRTGVKMLTGMTAALPAENPVPVNIHGPATRSYTNTPATEIVPAFPAGTIPACLTLTIAIDAWRNHYGTAGSRLLTGSVAISGQRNGEFDDDLPVATGTLGTTAIDNLRRLVTEFRSLSPTGRALLIDWCQGEADVNLTREQYMEQMAETISDLKAVVQQVTGETVPMLMWQTGGYRNTVSVPYGSTLSQIALARQHGVFGGPIYPCRVDDMVHPDLVGQKKFSEVGGYNWVRHEMGADVDMTPMQPTVIGNQFIVPFRTDGKSLAFDTDNTYEGYGGLVDHGFEVSDTGITSVELSGNSVVVTAGAALSGRTVSVAMQSQDMSGAGQQDAQGRGYPAHRCDILEADPHDSKLLPGTKMKRFIPSERWHL